MSSARISVVHENSCITRGTIIFTETQNFAGEVLETAEGRVILLMMYQLRCTLTVSRKKTSEVHPDVHVRLMMAYKEVPEWQRLLSKSGVPLRILVLAIAIGAAEIGAHPTQTSPAVVLYGVFLDAIFLIPIGTIPAYVYVTTSHTLIFAQDLKLAHYMHNRSLRYLSSDIFSSTSHQFVAFGVVLCVLTFWAKIWATLVSSFLCTAIINLQMTKIAGVCTSTQVDHFTCPGTFNLVSMLYECSSHELKISTHSSTRVFYGNCMPFTAIETRGNNRLMYDVQETPGPQRMFGTNGIYNSLLYCFPIVVFLPIPIFMLRKRFKVLEYFHLPVEEDSESKMGGLWWWYEGKIHDGTASPVLVEYRSPQAK
ncbi:hypothetical protein DFH09DRAFT_1407437 [Mycena vulgaris]|nr:hypothetical protein DFH09DRAFT_1407437 [Mycena vulgaris]